MRPLPHIILVAFLVLAAFSFSGFSQENTSEKESPEEENTPAATTSGIGPTLELSISRRSLPNFLSDEVALEPYLDADGNPQPFDSIFVIGSLQARHAVFWDSVSCRLMGVLDLKAGKETASSPYVLLASGPAPLSPTSAASGDPEYFGFRLVDGSPEFLYTLGSLIVEERIWLENQGDTLKQRFAFRAPTDAISILLPESWKALAEASVGTWKENVLQVETADAAEIVLTYQLIQPKPDDTN